MKPGTRVDRYVVEDRIGEGGMAAVYRVRHSTLGSRHALKVLTITSLDVRERLVQEGQVQASLHHPNIISVSDVLEVNGAPGLVMEFVQGPALDHWLYNYTPTLEEALTLFRGIVAGVGAAHAKGILHRDLKPANILLHIDDRGVHPKVTDFGLAKLTHGNNTRNTRTGTTMGTPQYMAPEQIRDASSVDRRADLYSLGVLLYELVCGEPPFKDDDVIELFMKVAAGDYRHPRDLHSNLPAQVVDCIEGLMEVNLDHRLSDCASILEVLDGADASAFTTPFSLEASDALPPARPMPANPGPTSLHPTTPGAAIANRWLTDLVSVQPEAPAPKPSEWGNEEETSALDLDLRTPTPPPAPPTKANWGARVLVIGLLFLVVLLLVTLLGTLGLLATGWQADDDPSFVEPTEQPAPDPAPEPQPTEPATPQPVEPAPVEPVPSEPVPSEPDPAPRPVPLEPEPVEAPTPQPVVPTPVPEAPAPVAKAVGRFQVQADTKTENVVLSGASGRFAAGEDVPAGDYTIIARFAGYPEGVAGHATIPAGGSIVIRCQSGMGKCR